MYNDQDSKLLAAEETRYDDFLKFVYEDFLKFIYEDFLKIIYENYGVDFSKHELELTVSVSLAYFFIFLSYKDNSFKKTLTVIYNLSNAKS